MLYANYMLVNARGCKLNKAKLLFAERKLSRAQDSLMAEQQGSCLRPWATSLPAGQGRQESEAVGDTPAFEWHSPCLWQASMLSPASAPMKQSPV